MMTLRQQLRAPILLLGLTSLAGAFAQEPPMEVITATPIAQEIELEGIKELHQKISALCQRIWTELAQLKSKEEADAHAPIFAANATQLAQLDHQLQQIEKNPNIYPESKDFLQSSSEKIINVYILVGNEFDSILAANCLDSIDLQRAFENALREGFFYTTQGFERTESITYFTAEEEKEELDRLQALHHPDSVALLCLSKVKDAASAKTAIDELQVPIQNLHELRPHPDLLKRHFRPTSQNLYIRFSHPLEVALWGIREEYIRIARSFTPESSDYNSLANTLDELYLSLEETHNHIFTIVFDDSFLSDMDAAYEKHSTCTITP